MRLRARLFAAVATLTDVNLYRSDDGGESWRVATDDTRPALRIGGGVSDRVRARPVRSAGEDDIGPGE